MVLWYITEDHNSKDFPALVATSITNTSSRNPMNDNEPIGEKAFTVNCPVCGAENHVEAVWDANNPTLIGQYGFLCWSCNVTIPVNHPYITDQIIAQRTK